MKAEMRQAMDNFRGALDGVVDEAVGDDRYFDWFDNIQMKFLEDICNAHGVSFEKVEEAMDSDDNSISDLLNGCWSHKVELDNSMIEDLLRQIRKSI